MFTGFNQNDLPEFLIFVINCFHTALSREVVMSIEGQIKDEKEQWKAEDVKNVKNRFNYFALNLFFNGCFKWEKV